MSEVIELRLDHEERNRRGIFRFDGEVVEIFGFNDIHSVRLHIAHIDGAEASFKSGMLASPMIKFTGWGGGLGYAMAIDPRPEQQPEIESFCAAVTAAAQRAG